MTIYCLNPDCPNPLNDDFNQVCVSCNTAILPLLRNRFRVIRVLSQEGAFGKTYLAQDSDKLNEPCVIKQLAPKIDDKWALNKALELFEKEAQLLQQLGEHPQIPKLLAYFEQDNYLYLVQQFIDGQNLLEEFCSRRENDIWLRCYSETEIRELLLNLLPVIQFIHESGVVHRDIKPQNIIRRISPKKLIGDLVLIDFGSSKHLQPKIKIKTGTSIGSHGYCAIEQIRDGLAYPASDLFSVGATSFHLITGISPFRLWTEHGYGWTSSWEKYLNYPLSDEFGEILDKLLKKDIEQRYQSAAEVIAHLKQTQNYSVFIPPLTDVFQQFIPPTEVPAKPKYTNLKTLLMAIAAIIMFVAGEIWYWQTREAQIRNSESIAQPSIQPVSKTEEQINQGQLAVFQTLDLNYDSTSSIAIAPDSKTMVTNSIFGVKLWSLVTKQEISVFNPDNSKVNVVAINAYGTKFVSAGDDKIITIWNLATGQQIRTLQAHSQPIHALVFSPDGKILASAGDDNSVKLWNVSTGQEITSFNRHGSRVNSLAFDWQGKMLASGSFDGTIKIWDITTQKLLRTLSKNSSKVYSVNFIKKSGTTSNSSVIGSYNNAIGMWNPITGEKIRTFRGHSRLVTSTAVSSQSNLLASGSSDNTIKLWNLETGELLITLRGHSGKIESLAFNKDGSILVSSASDKTIKVWQISRLKVKG
ncbi:MAG: serine/threonine-protein kinase [Nostocales cyanobacterium 94392]|nr:serine/threonine-protein kinase [Nostocales cyanobacterium 94392]